ncbi:MAG: hypothetical protein C4348_01695 [Patescibacteria group bacterium]
MEEKFSFIPLTNLSILKKMLEIFNYPFLIKSLILSFWLSLVFSFFGIFVLIKRMSFFSDGIAHASVFSLALAFLLNLDFFLISILGAIIFASLIFYLERKTKIHTDALIGLIFVSFLSLGLILISLKSGYQPELLSFLIGNLLTISDFDFYLILFFSIISIIFMIFLFKKMILVFLDRTESHLRGINVNFYEYLFYVFLAISVILGIKVMGMILVTAFLILPPMIASLISRSFKQMIILTLTLSVLNVMISYMLSFNFNLPLNATIILWNSIVFYFVFLLKTLKLIK